MARSSVGLYRDPVLRPCGVDVKIGCQRVVGLGKGAKAPTLEQQEEVFF
jgi:hypothetical protein